MMGKKCALRGLVTLAVGSVAWAAFADPVPPAPVNSTDTKSGERVFQYTPSQINPPRPKYDYTDNGQTIMVRRYPLYKIRDIQSMTAYKYVDNKNGVEHYEKGRKLKRQPNDILSEQQKEILAKWGQPEYLRGPYTSSRGDSVIEWAYLPLNHVFQFVDRTMVFEGPLTDAERTIIQHGQPSDVLVTQVEPNVRRETYIYRKNRPWAILEYEFVYSFANGKLLYSQENQ
ncbi:MAG: hypothetical protein K1X53_17780 [Candidatus Sumerlaeaceae bacterium]|nr:hypothetical protein [Candidatus Sumerlaeaceae bacterium]